MTTDNEIPDELAAADESAAIVDALTDQEIDAFENEEIPGDDR